MDSKFVLWTSPKSSGTFLPLSSHSTQTFTFAGTIDPIRRTVPTLPLAHQSRPSPLHTATLDQVIPFLPVYYKLAIYLSSWLSYRKFVFPRPLTLASCRDSRHNVRFLRNTSYTRAIRASTDSGFSVFDPSSEFKCRCTIEFLVKPTQRLVYFRLVFTRTGALSVFFLNLYQVQILYYSVQLYVYNPARGADCASSYFDPSCLHVAGGAEQQQQRYTRESLRKKGGTTTLGC
ncbi:hypothetical protein FB451DRAFT_1177580 [Mycena latifolia]|nr:hypothetical protein FB451DRAFT_1177580 [Mycena latifolia]